MSFAKSVPSDSSGSAYCAGTLMEWAKKEYRGNDEQTFHLSSNAVGLYNRISYYLRI